MKHFRVYVLAFFGVWAGVVGTAQASLLLDGDMDKLLVGTNPDVDKPAGAWFFPPEYLSPEYVAETDPYQLTIVPTSSFDPGAPGNSLRMYIDAGTSTNIHLPNIFTQKIPQKPGEFTRVMFDLFVPSGSWGGGSIYVGGNHSGSGFHFQYDRGPQLSWYPDGTLKYTIAGPTSITVVPAYPRDEWQTVQLDIDLVADNFDMYWGPKGGSLALVGTDLGFRSGTQDFLDRFTYVNFGGTIAVSSSYLDNVSVVVIPEPATACLLALAGLSIMLRRR